MEAYATSGGLRYIWRLTLHLDAYATSGGLRYIWRLTLHLEAYDTSGGLRYIWRLTLHRCYSYTAVLQGILPILDICYNAVTLDVMRAT